MEHPIIIIFPTSSPLISSRGKNKSVVNKTSRIKYKILVRFSLSLSLNCHRIETLILEINNVHRRLRLRHHRRHRLYDDRDHCHDRVRCSNSCHRRRHRPGHLLACPESQTGCESRVGGYLGSGSASGHGDGGSRDTAEVPAKSASSA